MFDMKEILISIRNWFLPQYYPIWSERGHWNITTDFGVVSDWAVYTVWYSKRLDRLKLTCEGYKPTSHSYYPTAIDVFKSLQQSYTP